MNSRRFCSHATLARIVCIERDAPPPPPQRDGSYVYATLHAHKVNDGTKVYDGNKRADVPSGWAIAPNEPDVVRVCGRYKWQSYHLVLGDGTAIRTDGSAGACRWTCGRVRACDVGKQANKR